MAWHLTLLNWLIHAGLGGSLFLLAGVLAVRWCRQPIHRVRIIELTLAGSLLVPWIGLLPGLPHLSIGWLTLEPAPPSVGELEAGNSAPGFSSAGRFEPEPVIPAAEDETVIASNPPSPLHDPGSEPVATVATAPVAAAPPTWSLAQVLAVIYGCMVAGILLRAVAGLGYLAWIRRRAYPAPQAAVEILQEIAGSKSRRVQLLVSETIAMPLTLPGWRPIILLPGSLCRSGDTAALRYSLAHEWSHVEGGDIWRWHLATLAQLLFFYQPLFWWLRWQLRLCQDYLADARAAEQAVETEDYAAYLVVLARHQLDVPSAALGIGDRRSNLYRRITMLLQSPQPLQRRCLALWTLGATLVALVLLVAASALRLDAGARAEDKKNDNAKEAPKEPAKDKPAEKGETLNYTCKVTDKDTGKPIAGAVVKVRRSLYGDPEIKDEDRLIEVTSHKTDADGKYQVTIPPEQSSKRYLYIELDVEHPDYAPRKGFGYALSMIRKNEKLGGRPFFEHVDLRPGKPITGQILTPEGKPVTGVKVLAYSNIDRRGRELEYGSFADIRTDKEGRFRLVLITPGPAVFWILPEDYSPSTHLVKDNKRGDLGTFTLSPGLRLTGKLLDARGNPLAGVYVHAEKRDREDLLGLPVADHIGRSGLTNEKGEFSMRPLPPGGYRVKPEEYNQEPSEDNRGSLITRPVPAVFVPMNVTLKEGGAAQPIEVRAVPHVTIQAQYLDSKGKTTRGHECFIFGQIDQQTWFGQGKADANGKIEARVPHGLENTKVDLMTNEHGVLRWRKTAAEPLNGQRQIDLGTVNDDVKGIEIIRYTAPILVIDAVDSEGKQVKGFKAQVVYAPGKSPKDPKSMFVNGVQGDVYLEKQEDGRWRTSQMLPDEEVTVTASAEGYAAKSTSLKVPEGETKDVKLVLDKVPEKKLEEKP